MEKKYAHFSLFLLIKLTNSVHLTPPECYTVLSPANPLILSPVWSNETELSQSDRSCCLMFSGSTL